MSVSDNFNRADSGTLGANWTLVEGVIGITSNMAKSANNDIQYNAAYWSAIGWGADQSSQIVNGANTLIYLAPIVRASSGPTYYGYFNNGNIIKRVAGSDTSIGSGSVSITAGDVMKAEITGTTLRCYLNGSQVGGDITDSSISSGSSGIGFYNQNAPVIDDWLGTGESAGAVVRSNLALLGVS